MVLWFVLGCVVGSFLMIILVLNVQLAYMDSKKIIPIATQICLPVFDGIAPDDWYAPISFSWGNTTWQTCLAQLSATPLINMKEEFGNAIFLQIIGNQDYIFSNSSFQHPTRKYLLSLYYFVLTHENNYSQTLIVASSGEFQPARWQAYIEGIWELQVS
jgi:hypothetical protein